MGYLDTTYTSGVIAVREKYLLNDKIFRFCELTAEEAFRLLLDSGFGGGAETTGSVFEYEKLIAVEEKRLDEFIREFSPSKTEREFLLAPRDFHNAKALIKSAYLNEDPSGMLMEEGNVTLDALKACVQSGDFSSLSQPLLSKACTQAIEQLQSEPSGAKVGVIFEKALYEHLRLTVKNRRVLKELLYAKADMTNILISLRCGDEELSKEKYLHCGKLKTEKYSALFTADSGAVKEAYKDTPYLPFVTLCLNARERGLPFTQAERLLGGYDATYFAQKKYELKKNEPFLYYVYRRQVEIANVRIVFACLLAGLNEQDIKRRLRAM